MTEVGTDELTERFRRLFHRDPTRAELLELERAHTGLVMRLPPPARRGRRPTIRPLMCPSQRPRDL